MIRFTSDYEPLLSSEVLRSVHQDDSRDRSDCDELLNRETMQLRFLGRSKQPKESRTMFKEVPIKSGDTLVNLALRYNCSVSNLSRK